MPKLSTTELGAILSAQKADALSGDASSKLSDERSAAMKYYLGDVSDDMPTVEGRSRAVSTDVADTVEGLMPSLMEIFCGSDEVIRFEPVGKEDIKAAEQETDYVNHVFMQQNQGFLVLYSFIKDALLQKNGIVKVFWEEKETDERKTYYDQPDDTYAALLAEPGMEVVEHTERDDGYGGRVHDVTLACKKKYSCARVEPVPPEEFGIARNAKNLRECDYCYHEVTKSEGKLIEEGYDPDQIKTLPTYTANTGQESIARDTVDESTNTGDSINRALRLIRVTEHYCRLDYEGTGRIALYRITTGGESSVVLRRKGELDIVEEDFVRFAGMTPVIMTHRFFGRSVADLVSDIQRIKTALVRGALDNLYLHNNPRVEVAESHASENTLDDLLVSRPGGVVRTRQPGGVQWQVVPDITAATYPALQYWDATREWRTGVTRQGQGIDADALQNQTATAANQLYSAAQARMKLIARIFAETGIKDLFWLLHGTIRKHGKKPETVRLRNEWVTVDPRNWQSRNDMTISVGLGSGGKEQQLAFLQLIIGAQEKAVALGMVSKNNFWNSAKELVKLIGRKDPEAFFTAPNKQPQPGEQPDPAAMPIEAPTDPKVMQIEMQAKLDEASDQRKAQIETVQAEADIASKRDQIQAEMVRDDREHQLKKELAVLEFQLERELKMAELEMKREMHQQTLAQNAEQHRQQIEAGTFKVAAGAQAHQQKMEQNEARE